MKTALLVMFLSFGAFAAEPATDAPVVLARGDTAPSAGLFLPETLAISSAKRVVSCEAQVAVYEKKQLSPVVTVLLVVTGVVVVGAAAGVVGYEVGKSVPR